MKTMKCNQLGGACEREFHAETFDEMAQLSKAHAMVMLQQKDQPHVLAMQQMQSLMQDSQAMEAWMDKKRMEFDALAND